MSKIKKYGHSENKDLEISDEWDETLEDEDEYEDYEDEEFAQRSKKRKRALFIALTILILPFIIFGTWLYVNVNGFGSPGESVSVEIQKGSGVKVIGEALEYEGVIRSANAFAIYTKLANRGPYQAGKYEFPKNIGVKQAAEILEKGPSINYEAFTILPGERLTAVKNNISQLPNMSEEGVQKALDSGQFRSKFLPEGSNNLEGLLMPETYSIAENETEADLILRALQEFEARASSAGLISKHGLTTYEIIIVASMIEREAGNKEEKPRVASVIYNRLKIDMRLQIDATVAYGLNQTKLNPGDLQKDTPFNTYTRAGLPPTPISMISIDSLLAAINPEDTNYLYYVLSNKETGDHAFSKTYEEHLANIEKAKKSGNL